MSERNVTVIMESACMGEKPMDRNLGIMVPVLNACDHCASQLLLVGNELFGIRQGINFVEGCVNKAVANGSVAFLPNSLHCIHKSNARRHLVLVPYAASHLVRGSTALARSPRISAC